MRDSRWYHIILVGVIVLALVGFLIGTREKGYEQAAGAGFESVSDADSDGSSEPSAPPAPTYTELMTSGWDKNAHWRGALSAAQRSDEIDEQIDGTRRTTSWRGEPRATNRAYGGAPPTVPHPIRQKGDLACAGCHTDGIRVGERVGPPMSHDFMANCTQCHAASSPKLPFSADRPATIAAKNSFQGRPERTDGPRAYDGAPPRIPHRVEMRENCAGCHGDNGRPGPMAHEYMPNCQQCHAAGEAPPTVGGGPDSVPLANNFQGNRNAWDGGARAMKTSPPQIPHQLHMRGNCASCHGVNGEPSIKTDHPNRQSCTQCHAPSGKYDFRPPTNLRPF